MNIAENPEFSQRKESGPWIQGLKSSMKRSPLLTIIALLMALQVLLGGFQVVRDLVRDQQAEAQRVGIVAEVARYTANLDELTTQMLADYKQEVYNNPDVNSAAKQEVMGTEYNYMAIMLLIQQNTRMMEMLAELP